LEPEEDSDRKQFVMHTPIGLISHRIRKDADDALNFWVGHTNFDIDKTEYPKILNVHGVEIFTLFTAYSFRICVGKMFDEKAVMKNVGESLGCNFKERIKYVDLKNKSQIIQIKKQISSKKYWCIYILPNGNFEHFATDDSKEFLE